MRVRGGRAAWRPQRIGTDSRDEAPKRRCRTDLFIRRGYDWKVVDLMLTNFHLPRTTLLMMIDAFIGGRWHDIYASALRHDYRFLSFGDAMLLDRHA
ncbi:MAG: S-adenosylmethionine:tRNA ribosyltransferase-isomerase, partial [Actinomycetota bacterium]